jgi:tol-pal system protein YbgF
MRRFALALITATASLPALAVDIPDRRGAPPGAVPTAPAANGTRETLVDLLLQIEQLQTEIRSLRGQVETQTHEIERLKARQRDAAADFDRRLREMERRGTPAAGAGGESSTETVATAASAAEQLAYDTAFGQLKQGNYDKAAKAFREFVARYPQSPLADNGQYWIGEALYVGRHYKVAREEFAKVLADYPGSNKAADAALKIGYCHYELGEYAKAREALTRVPAKYPGSRAAKSAEERLARMKKEKR